MSDPEPTSNADSDPNLAAINRKLNWLTGAVALLFVVELVPTIVGVVSIHGSGLTRIVLLGGGLVVLAALLAVITSNYD